MITSSRDIALLIGTTRRPARNSFFFQEFVEDENIGEDEAAEPGVVDAESGAGLEIVFYTPQMPPDNGNELFARCGMTWKVTFLPLHVKYNCTLSSTFNVCSYFPRRADRAIENIPAQ